MSKQRDIDFGDEQLALYVMEIHDAFQQQTERDGGDLTDIDFEDGILKLNGEFDLWRIAHAVMMNTREGDR
jgi:hypothetical protein